MLYRLTQGLTEAGLNIKQGQVSIIDAKQNLSNKGIDGENSQDKEGGYNVK